MDREVRPMNRWDKDRMRKTISVALSARNNGNHPFGAILTDKNGIVLLSAENSVITDKDCSAHAELNLIRKACKAYTAVFLSNCTIFASTEPCPMCAGAIFWSNIRRVVYGVGEEKLYALIGTESEEILYLPCQDVFNRGNKSIEVIGPLLEDEALQVHKGFWK